MKTIAVFALALCTIPLIAQKATPVEVKVQQVNDRRTSGSFSRLTIDLELPKILSSEVAASRVLIAAATDDSGQSLIDPEAGEPELELNFRRAVDDKAPPATISVALKNPARAAMSVKEVRGEVELYMPGKDPNSVAEIARFVSFSGKPLAHKALKANGVEIALLSKPQIEAERKRIADAKRKEYKADGWEDGESLDQTIASVLETALPVEESDLLLRIKDPSQRIQELAYVDAAGEVKRISTREEEGLTWLSTWGEKPQGDWKLRISMKTPKNMVRHSFAVKDVPLP